MISVQLYSLRADAPNDFHGILRSVAGFGYDAVEFAGYHNYPVEDLRKTMDEVGLQCSGTHTGIHLLEGEGLSEQLRIHDVLGTKNIIIPWLPAELHNTVEATLKTAERLSKLAAEIAPDGFRLGFHTHDCDMTPLEDGRSTWYVLAENTPDSFIMQFDTANAVHGGGDPVQPLLDFPGRGLAVHLKEYPFNGECIGEGTIPFDRVIKACRVAGTEYFVVEQESYGDRSPLESVRVCRENLRKLGL